LSCDNIAVHALLLCNYGDFSCYFFSHDDGVDAFENRHIHDSVFAAYYHDSNDNTGSYDRLSNDQEKMKNAAFPDCVSDNGLIIDDVKNLV